MKATHSFFSNNPTTILMFQHWENLPPHYQYIDYDIDKKEEMKRENIKGIWRIKYK